MKKPKQIVEAKRFDELPKEAQALIKEAIATGNLEFVLDEDSKADMKENGITEQDIFAALLKDAKMIN